MLQHHLLRRELSSYGVMGGLREVAYRESNGEYSGDHKNKGYGIAKEEGDAQEE